MARDALALLDEVRAIAQTGLHYAEDPYDRERYERLLDLACEGYGDAFDLPSAEVRERLAGDLGSITPKVGAEAAVFDEEGRILLQKRADDATWCLPCGWVAVGEAPAETAVRETREETGLAVRVLELVDVSDLPPGPVGGPHGQVAVSYLCERTGGELELSHEGLDLGYWVVEEVPAWHKVHERFARAARERWRERQATGSEERATESDP